MNRDRFGEITGRYLGLRVAVVGDFFLDRYLEIDPARAEVSIETGLPVHNVVRVRSQPGAAGTILNNLVALGVGTIHAVGFCGDDGEGYELRRALADQPGVVLDHFLTSSERRTPVYGKPLVLEIDQPPRELNRLDSKNWTPTPIAIQHDLAARVSDLAGRVDAILLMDQVDHKDTGVVTAPVRQATAEALRAGVVAVAVADSRRGLGDYPPLVFKMNAAELARMAGEDQGNLDPDVIARLAADLADRVGQPVFVTMAERGIVGASPVSETTQVAAFPIRGPIDIVGAGDSVTANLVAALAAGASVAEAMAVAMAAASVVVHQLGTTGTASVAEVADRLGLGSIR